MEQKQTSIFENGLIWFGAAVSIAEIMTGTIFAPLGFVKGIFAIILGHIIGCALMFFSGYIGGKTRQSAMNTVARSFGMNGRQLFVVLNIIQLLGWTSIMIYDGGIAANQVFNISNSFWCIMIGLLIILWILVGVRNLGRLNTISMSLLFVLTIVLSIVIFKKDVPAAVLSKTLTFGAAVELSVGMPLSWLPLISDYTREAKSPTKATLASVVTYGVISSWMYLIGMGAAIIIGSSDMAEIIMKSGLGIAGLLIIVLSTVTTTFLDAYSAGVSSESISNKINSKWFAVATTILGVIAAIVFKISNITDFLYFIGSVFAPMIAIQIADFYIIKNDHSEEKYSFSNLTIWLAGFIIYRYLMRIDFALGNTLPSVLITIAICVAVNAVKFNRKRS